MTRKISWGETWKQNNKFDLLFSFTFRPFLMLFLGVLITLGNVSEILAARMPGASPVFKDKP